MNTAVIVTLAWSDGDKLDVHYLASTEDTVAYFPDREDYKLTTRNGKVLSREESIEAMEMVKHITVRVPHFVPECQHLTVGEAREVIKRARVRLAALGASEEPDEESREICYKCDGEGKHKGKDCDVCSGTGWRTIKL